MSDTNKLLKIIIFILLFAFFPVFAYFIGVYGLILLIPMAIVAYSLKLNMNGVSREANDMAIERSKILNQLYHVPFIIKIKDTSDLYLYNGFTTVPNLKDERLFKEASYGLEIRIDYVAELRILNSLYAYGRIYDGKNYMWIQLNNKVFVDADQSIIDDLTKFYLDNGVDKNNASYRLCFFDDNKVHDALEKIYPATFMINNDEDGTYKTNWRVNHNLGYTIVTAQNEEMAAQLFMAKYPNCKIVNIKID